ncbi:MAG: M28 family peptidase [Actinobacteria bacterium]|nr:MAG: M28 family peptidase [Actinomycetota bacterium]
MPELIEYVHTLAEEIGPRPATTDAEHRAAEWLEHTFASRGLETEVQEFSSPHTYSWAYVLYHLLTLASAFLAGFYAVAVWPAFAVSAIVAFVMWNDLETRWGLSRIMPKGPSQNVIARHVPRQRRGEKLRRIVVVAHYDSARASLAFAPGMVKNFATTFALMKWCTFLTPVFILAMALPFTAKAEPWLWYATMAVSAYLLVPLVINVHRELFMPYVAGANDNASGVAAMLGVMEALVPAPDANSLVTTSFPSLRRDAETIEKLGLLPEGTELRYTPAGGETSTELPDDFEWAEPGAEKERPRGQAVLDFDTVEFAAVGEDAPRPRSSSGTTGSWAAEDATDEAPVATGPVLPAEVAGYGEDEIAEQRRERGGLLGRLKPKRKEHDAGPTDWLGVDDSFDARKAGKEIGSWDKFAGGGDEDDDDAAGGLGWKGGWAGDDPIGDPEFASSEAARIRRRVTETIDRELTEKEVWFVATGAEEVGTYGMQALLRDYGHELRDALIINIDGCGAGSLYWASIEGMARRHRANPRLTGLARRVSRETETLIKPRPYKGLSTDASPALARGYKAMSIMAFDSEGMPVNWHWKSDTIENVDAELIEKTAEFVTAMVREA